jgi:hypothetical protein
VLVEPVFIFVISIDIVDVEHLRPAETSRSKTGWRMRYRRARAHVGSNPKMRPLSV